MSRMKKRKLFRNITYIFIIIEIIIYISFLYLDCYVEKYFLLSNRLKYISILLCFLYILIEKKQSNRLDKILMPLALFFTLCADWSLLLHNNYTIGVCFFLIVQFLYFMRLGYFLNNTNNGRSKIKGNSRNKFMINYGCNMLLAFFLCSILSKIGLHIGLFIIITTLYFASIVQNVLTAIYLALLNKNFKYNIFAIGMSLFLLCDINVGINNSQSFITVHNAFILQLIQFSSIGMWLFYLPAQVLIALSLLEYHDSNL